MRFGNPATEPQQKIVEALPVMVFIDNRDGGRRERRFRDRV